MSAAAIPNFDLWSPKQGPAAPNFDEWSKQQEAHPPAPIVQPKDMVSRFLAGSGEGMGMMGNTLMHPLETLKSFLPPSTADIARMAQGDPMERARQLPIVGPMLQGDFARGAGQATPLALTTALGPSISRGTGTLMRAGAEPLAESALGIRAVNRAYNRNPGAAALDETTGVRPSTVASSARDRLEQINTELESKVGQSQAPADLDPSRRVLSSAEMKARGQNAAGTVKQLQPMQSHLNTDMNNGLPIPNIVAPLDLLNLKRGFGNEFIHNWNPETMTGVRGTAAQTYHQLADTLHRAVPESGPLDERASSLIPVADRAEAVDRNAGIGQNILHRVGAHTGALAGSALGFHEAGIPGAVAGLVIPEMLASPTSKMIAARTLNAGSKALQSPISGQALRTLPAISLVGEANKKQNAK